MKQKLLLMFAILATAINASAYSFMVDGIYYNILSQEDLTCEVASSNSKYSGDIVIPSTITYNQKTFSVTSIGDNAFSFSPSLTSVVIPNSVKSISDYAFYRCTSITSLEIPSSVISIGDAVFYGCENLESFTGKFASDDHRCLIVDGVLKSVAPARLTNYEIPNSVTEIGKYAIQLCSSLTSVVIPESVTSIRNGAFVECYSLTSVEIPNSVTEIEYQAFALCQSLKSVVIGNSVTSIGDRVFYDCPNLESFSGKFASADHRCMIVDGVLKAFAPAGLTSYEIPNSVTKIGDYAFYYCKSLTSVVIPNSVTEIGYSAFDICENLTSVTIGKSVTSIGDYAFSCGYQLATITSYATTPPTLGVSSFFSPSTCTLYVPYGSKELYAKAEQWKDFENIEELGTVITLADGETYAGNEDMNDADVTYTRTFNSTDWQPLYVPFNMSYDEWSDYGTVAELACVHVYEDGKTAIEFVTVNGGELLPNIPYVIKPKAKGKVTFNCTGKQLKAAPVEGEKYISCSSPRYIFKLFGNYQPISASTLAGYGDPLYNGAYVMAAGNKFAHASNGTQLSPYRFYITREKNPNGYWSAPARNNMPAASDDDTDVIYFMIDGQVTSILSVSKDSADDTKVYDLNGIETRDPHNGVFIKNGKKMYIK